MARVIPAIAQQTAAADCLQRPLLRRSRFRQRLSGGVRQRNRKDEDMGPQRIIERLDQLIAKGGAVLQTHRPNPPNVLGFPTLDSGAFTEWRTQALTCLVSVLGDGHVYVENFKEQVQKGFQGTVKAGIGILKATKEDLMAGDLDKAPEQIPLLLLEQICSRFHLIARQLRSRYAGRPTLDVQDEYDVQDLMHALLCLHFVDVRPEEYTPSYAGKASRMDFLLKQESIVVEIKMTRSGLGPKELSTQLIEDIERYKVHPDCQALFCFEAGQRAALAQAGRARVRQGRRFRPGEDHRNRREQAGLTAVNTITGTPLYMAPEAIQTPEAVDARTDLYALGAVAWFLLVGRPPFEGRTIVEVCGHHLHTPPLQPSVALGRPVPRDLEAVVLSCLEKRAENRPADARVLRKQLLACSAAGQWTAEQAIQWWSEHEPSQRPRAERRAHDRARRRRSRATSMRAYGNAE